jgi:hypothetical protein
MGKKDYQKEDQWFVPGWFEPTTDQDKRDAKTLCNIIAQKQSKLEVNL